MKFDRYQRFEDTFSVHMHRTNYDYGWSRVSLKVGSDCWNTVTSHLICRAMLGTLFTAGFNCVFGAFAKVRTASIRSSWSNSAPTGRVFMKFDT